MRPRIQVELVIRHKKYLEEQIQVLEPVLEVMKQAVEKSQTWVDDKNDNPSITYIEIHQDLESATLLLINATTSIINENQEHADVEKGTSSLSQSTQQTTATEKLDINTNQVTKDAQLTLEIVNKLKLIETNLVSLQDTRQKAEEEISELKIWRDNFMAEQNDKVLKVEQLNKKQKQNFKNLRKQMSEQDNKVKELNKEFESLKDRETKSNKTLEKLCLDMKDYENSLHKINKEMQDHTNKTNSLPEEMKRQSDLIVTLQEEVKNDAAKLNVMYRIVQQRMMPIDKIIQVLNQNFEAKEQTTKKD